MQSLTTAFEAATRRIDQRILDLSLLWYLLIITAEIADRNRKRTREAVRRSGQQDIARANTLRKRCIPPRPSW